MSGTPARSNTSARRPRRGASASSQSGMALVLVLWAVTLLAVIASSFSLGIRRDVTVLRYAMDVAATRSAAEAGLYLSMLGLMQTDPEIRWQSDGAPHSLTYDGIELTIKVGTESARIDINAAEPALIDGALLVAGLDDDTVRQDLVDNILDWRGSGSHSRGDAVSRSNYAAADLSYGPRKGPFVNVEEIMLVPGMTPLLFKRLKPMLTVFPTGSGVDTRSASPDVLRALPGFDAATIDEFIEQRSEAWSAGQPVLSLDGVMRQGIESGFYRVEIEARARSGVEQGLRAVLGPQRAPGGKPYSIQYLRFE